MYKLNKKRNRNGDGYRYLLRYEVLKHYNNSEIPFCACCKEKEEDFLSIDHIYGRKNKSKKESYLTGIPLYTWLKRNGYPAGFQVLCHNCNQAKGYYGKCPHEQNKIT